MGIIHVDLSNTGSDYTGICKGKIMECIPNNHNKRYYSPECVDKAVEIFQNNLCEIKNRRGDFLEET